MTVAVAMHGRGDGDDEWERRGQHIDGLGQWMWAFMPLCSNSPSPLRAVEPNRHSDLTSHEQASKGEKRCTLTRSKKGCIYAAQASPLALLSSDLIPVLHEADDGLLS